MKLTVVIKPSPSTNPIHFGQNVMNQLRAAGVPVIGTLWPVCAENGQLTSYDVGGDLVYEWEGEEEKLF